MQQIVMPFDGQVIEVIRDECGKPWVSVRSVCQAIGIDVETQRRKLISDTRFRCGHMTAPSIGGMQETFCIPLEQLNGWLFGINPNKVPEHVRPALVAYQQECFSVLYKHFMPRGEIDLQPFMDRFDRLDKKLDQLAGIADTVLGDDKDEIQTLVQQVADVHNVDGRTVWGWIQTELDIQSYKRQNRKIINFLKNKLGKGLTLVKEN